MNSKESQALQLLRDHRSKIAGSSHGGASVASGGHSGDDYQRILEENARLNALAAKQRSVHSESMAYEQGKAAYNKRKAELSPTWRGKTQTLGELVRSVVPISPPEYDDNLFCYVGVGSAAIRAGLQGASMIFDILKRHARLTGGRYTYSTKEILLLCGEFGLQKRRVYKYLADGCGVFWDRYTDRNDKRQHHYRIRGIHRIDLDIPDVGEAVKLPKQAYQSNSAVYTDHILAAWLRTHDTASRDNQQAAFERTKQNLRNKQKRANVRSQHRFIKAPIPANPQQALTLAELLQDSSGILRHHWFTRGYVHFQTSNAYSGGSVVELGKMRSGYIRVGREIRVNGESVKAKTYADYPITFHQSWQESAYSKAMRYQSKTRKAVLYEQMPGEMTYCYPIVISS